MPALLRTSIEGSRQETAREALRASVRCSIRYHCELLVMKSSRIWAFGIIATTFALGAGCSAGAPDSGTESFNGNAETGSSTTQSSGTQGPGSQAVSAIPHINVALTKPALIRASKDARIARDVLEQVELSSKARVLIAFDVPELQQPSALRYGQPAREALKRAIAQRGSELVRGFDSARVHHRFRSLNAVAVTVEAADLERLLARPDVRRIQLDESGGEGHLAESVPLAGMASIHAAGITGNGVTVGVLDTGVDLDHPDLADAVVAEACFCSGNSGCCPDGSAQQSGAGSAQDDHGHGTNIAGIITSNGSIAPKGGAPGANIVAVKVMDSQNRFCCSSDVLAGIDYIISEHPEVQVVNASLGTSAMTSAAPCDGEPGASAWKTAVDTLRANGVLFFASSGNQGSATSLPFPACVESTVAVGAVYDSNFGPNGVFCSDPTTAPDKLACFSNSNPAVDIVAPGAPMTSTGLGGGTSTFFGTSQASALAAACAALLLEKEPSLSPEALETLIETSEVIVTDARNGLSFPRLDCQRALDELSGCIPVCQGRVCGDDGCGGSCGSCGEGEVCTSEGTCSDVCTPSCQGRVCGDDGCGGSCGSCGEGEVCTSEGTCSAGTACDAPAWEPSRAYVRGDVVSLDGNEYTAAYWTRNQNPAANNGPPGSGQPWRSPDSCAMCVPNCTGKVCGDDGCGGSCGTCSGGEQCTAAGQCTAGSGCTAPAWDPSRAYVQGDVVSLDGREYTAAYWTRNQNPAAHNGPPGSGQPWRSPDICAVCVPNCAGKVCGDDGCGGSCGTCAGGQSCDAGGQCVGDGCAGIPSWETGTQYNAGDEVQSAGGKYRCKPWPYTAWCGQNDAYEPGVGFAWQQAWERVGSCN